MAILLGAYPDKSSEHDPTGIYHPPILVNGISPVTLRFFNGKWAITHDFVGSPLLKLS
jgi:hypothetical protein